MSEETFMVIVAYVVIGITWSIVLFKLNGGADFLFEAIAILLFGAIWPITIPIWVYIFVEKVIKYKKAGPQ